MLQLIQYHGSSCLQLQLEKKKELMEQTNKEGLLGMQQVAIIHNMPCFTTVATYFERKIRSIPNSMARFSGRWRWVFAR